MLPNAWLDNAANVEDSNFSHWGVVSPSLMIAMALTNLDVITENSLASPRRLESCRLFTSRRDPATRMCDSPMSPAKPYRCQNWRVIRSSPDAWKLDADPNSDSRAREKVAAPKA